MPVKLAFFDTTFGDYTPQTPLEFPLGGAQAAVCHLSVAMAQAGADVTLINGTSRPGMVRGVACRRHDLTPLPVLSVFDYVVVLYGCDSDGLRQLRASLNRGQKLILWTQHAADQADVANLADPAIANAWDAFVFVSRWQQESFIQRYKLKRWRCHILRNAPAPCFGDLFSGDADPLSTRPWPPVLAYTSTPYRGLDVLLDAWPRILAAIPGAVLRVYSSLAVYQVPEESDPFTALYDRCRRTAGVEYVGGLPAPELARALCGVNALAYPNRFAETSCIALMEAMAAGCEVLSSRLGALPETLAGFGRLVPVPVDPAAHADAFADAMITMLRRQQQQPDRLRQILRTQVEHVDAAHAWGRRAAHWLSWLSDGEGWQAPASNLAGLLPRLRSPVATGDHDGILHLCGQALALDPGHAGLWYLMVDSLMHQARYADAALALAWSYRAGRGLPMAEWRRHLPRLLSGIASGEDVSPVGHLVTALWGLLPFLTDDVDRRQVAAASRQLANQACAREQFDGMASACRLAAFLSPDDGGVRLAAALALDRLGDPAGAVIMSAEALHAGGSIILADRDQRTMVDRYLDAALTATLMMNTSLTDGDAASLFTAIADVGAALGEEVAPARLAAEARRSAPERHALLLRLLAARRRRQGRMIDQVDLLRQAVALSGDAQSHARLDSARLALAQRQMLDNLASLLTRGANGWMQADWQIDAMNLSSAIRQTLFLAQNDEAERSTVWGSLCGFDAFLAYFRATSSDAGPLPAPGPAGRKVYDCFQFYNELDLLDLRLAELNDVVDHFVLVEAKYTHAGAPKPLYFAENKARFAAYADKIIHIVVDDDPGGFAWVREAYQREAISRGLVNADAADLVIIGDADEILRPDVVTRMRHSGADGPALFAPHLDISLYFLNLRAPDPWISVAAASWSLVRRVGANNMRYLAKQRIGETIAHAGWHFTWMGGIDRFLAKMAAFAHREMVAGFEKDDAGNRERLARFFKTGRFEEGAVPGMWTALTRVPIDNGFPTALHERLALFTAMGWIAPEAE